MNNILVRILLLLLISPIVSYGQNIEDIGLITIGIGYPANANKETVDYFDTLSKKVSKTITKKGIVSYNDCQFQCIPEVNVESIDIAEAGMKDVYLLKGNITITAIDTLSGNIINTYSDPIKGHSTSKDKAIANAINEASIKNFNSGIDDLKIKICEYYRKNKEVFINRAQSIANQGNYDEAIALLLNFPSVILPDYYDCLSIADCIYNKKLEEQERQRIVAQIERNNAILTKADNALAASKPEDALVFLMDYEIGIEDLDNEYKRIRQSAQVCISNEKKLEYERQERTYRDARADKEKDYELAHKFIDTNQQIENRKLDIAQERIYVAERIENKKIDAYSSLARERTQSEERIETQRIEILKKIALNARIKHNKQ